MLSPEFWQLQTGGGCSGTSRSGDVSLPGVTAEWRELGKWACAHVVAETWREATFWEKIPKKMKSPLAVYLAETDRRQAAGNYAEVFNAVFVILKTWGCLVGT